MHLVATILLLLLACRESMQGTITVAIDPPLTTNFTIFDNFDNGVVSLGAGVDGILEVQPNSTQRWLFEQVKLDYYIIRDSMSNRFLYFPEFKPGTVATVSKTAASVVSFSLATSALAKFYINQHFYAPDLYFTVEPYSSEVPNRLVLRLQESAYGKKRQQFVLVKSPGNGS
ncbi:hypothetical protein MaudCBS49596_000714 [Microsporum audouinii]